MKLDLLEELKKFITTRIEYCSLQIQPGNPENLYVEGRLFEATRILEVICGIATRGEVEEPTHEGNEKLKPCPLCGSAVEVDELTADPEKGGLPELGKVWIQCSNPKCIIDIEETLRFTTKKEFIKKWNTRTGEK